MRASEAGSSRHSMWLRSITSAPGAHPPLAQAVPDPALLDEAAGHDGERAERTCVVVQLGGLLGGPADQPDVDVLVAAQQAVPAPFRIDLDLVAAGAHLVGDVT